jgi:uncharacterized protein YgbK (DUF1537 family)
VGLANRLTVAKGALRARLDELAAQGVAHVVVDAVGNDDLGLIAEACRSMPLLTGGSAVAMPLPGLWQAQGLLPRSDAVTARRAPNGPAILLSGSCSAMTNRQVATALADGRPAFRLDPADLAEHGSAPVLDWLAAQPAGATPLVYATALPEAVRASQARLGVDRAGLLVEEALAACAVAARGLGTRRFVVAGGETSGAVAKALAIDRLDIGREIAPGVPWCFASSGGQAVAITLKSGNFGAETFFADALGMLDR